MAKRQNQYSWDPKTVGLRQINAAIGVFITQKWINWATNQIKVKQRWKHWSNHWKAKNIVKEINKLG